MNIKEKGAKNEYKTHSCPIFRRIGWNDSSSDIDYFRKKEQVTMNITLKINADNAAFELSAGQEVSRILMETSYNEHLQDWDGTQEFSLSIRDINGNKIGEIKGENQ